MTSKQIEKYWLKQVRVFYLNSYNDPCNQIGIITAVGERFILFHANGDEGDERPVKIEKITDIKEITQ